MKRILILLVPVVIIFLAFRPVKSITVSGTITDETGATLAGITVKVKGTSTGVMSSNNGTYKITAPNENDKLLFSGPGLEPQEIVIKGRSVINITLRRAALMAQEVVVTAYSQKRRSEK